MTDSEETLQVNKFARRKRHMRVFSKTVFVKNFVMEMLRLLFSPLCKFYHEFTPVLRVRRFFRFCANFVSEKMPVSPQKRLLTQAIALSVSAVFITSFSTAGTFSASSAHYSADIGGTYAVTNDFLVSDEHGYLVKMNPQTHESNRIGLTDYAVHTVASGETLSTIAEDYGVSSNTIKWENNISNADSIRVGQNILVPPVDGISYTVEGGDTLSSIASEYDIETDSIVAQNSLETETINRGESLFLPGAEPIAPSPVIAQAPASTSSSTSTSTVQSASTAQPTPAVSAAPSSADPASGRPFIFPTRGNITQGYRAGHYAIDIADRSRPPVWSAAGGTVVKASVGTWGGGYGNHVIIDHGDGLQTLYAHLGSVNVSQGQWVNQGDVIGMMGNTGRVYGATGIHLHWEVHLNGVRQNPRNYY